MSVPFVKMHGLGNDYLFIDARQAASLDPFVAAPMVCDRERGIGADGIVMYGPPVDPGNDAWMTVVNADGSDGGVCGNGLRCLAMLLAERRGTDHEEIRVETPGGVVRLRLGRSPDGGSVMVEADMGPPRLKLAAIPAVVPGWTPEGSLIDRAAGELSGFDASSWGLSSDARISLVSMGNPHLVILLREGGTRAMLDQRIREIGPGLEGHPWFPERINVHLMAIDSPGRIRLSTWERGSGPTRACGTGACAAAVAARLAGAAPAWQEVELPGGRLDIGWNGSPGDPVRQRGPAEEILRGVLDGSVGLEPGTDSGEDGG